MNTPPNRHTFVERHTVIVGFFIAGATLILAGGILTIGDLNDTFTRRIVVHAVFREVNGLQEGDNVWFSGMKVGIVGTLGFDEQSMVSVEMNVDKAAAQHIHQDALAKIGSDGIIGSQIVVIYGGTNSAPTLTEGTILEIGETVSTEAVMTMLQENNVNLLAITTDLRTITGKLARGEGTVGKLIADETLYDSVAKTADTLGEAAVGARKVSTSLADFGANLNRPGSLPNAIVTDTTTYPAIQSAVADLQYAGKRTSDLMDGLADDAQSASTPIGTLLHDQKAGADMKATLDNLNDSSRLLKEDLAAIQDNFLFRGYFKKQERERAKAKAKADKATPPSKLPTDPEDSTDPKSP